MKKLQKAFSKDLQNALNLLGGQPDISGSKNSYPYFTHNRNSNTTNPIQIVITPGQNDTNSRIKNKTKTKTKCTTPRKSPVKKHKKTFPNPENNDSITETSILNDDPNIQIMFNLFCTERIYQKKRIKRLFDFWYKCLAKKLIHNRYHNCEISTQTEDSYLFNYDSRQRKSSYDSSLNDYSGETTDDYIQITISPDHSIIVDPSDSGVGQLNDVDDELGKTQTIENVLAQTLIDPLSNNSDFQDVLSNKSDNIDLLTQNSEQKEAEMSNDTSLNQKSSTKENSQQSKLMKKRPLPIDINLKPIPQSPLQSQRGSPKSKGESDLKRYLRSILSEELFKAAKEVQAQNLDDYPVIKISPNVQKPWQFSDEYCDLIVDVVTELIQTTKLFDFTFEGFLEYLSYFFEKARKEKQKTIFPELEQIHQREFDEFIMSYTIGYADSLLEHQLDYILGV